MPASRIKRSLNKNMKRNYYLISIENISEKFLYFKVICQNEIAKIKLKLKTDNFTASYFLQEDYKKNPNNIKINIIEKSPNRKELEALMRQYKEEFQYDLYPETLSYHPPNYFRRIEDDVLINIDEFCYLPGGV